VLRLTRSHGERRHHQLAATTDKKARLARRQLHLLLLLLPATTTRSVALLEGPHDLEGYGAVAERRLTDSGTHLKAFFATLYCTALRTSEAVMLREADLPERRIEVEQPAIPRNYLADGDEANRAYGHDVGAVDHGVVSDVAPSDIGPARTARPMRAAFLVLVVRCLRDFIGGTHWSRLNFHAPLLARN
jgi:hypothetical protein